MFAGSVDSGLSALAPSAPAALLNSPSFEGSMRFAETRGQGGNAFLTGSAEDPRSAAEELVALTLIQPVLASVRSSSMAEAPFAPGIAEERFGPLLDAAIARKIVKASNFGLVDAVARKLRGASMEASANDQQGNPNIDTAA